MTVLSDPMIADACRKAGFSQPTLPVAIASAIAASNGIPAFEHIIWPGPVAHYKGLFGVDVVQYPELRGESIENPYVAARWAWILTRATGGFGWCPAFRSGSHLSSMDRGRVASSLLPGREGEVQPVSVETYRRSSEMEHRALAARIDMARAHHPSGR